VFSYKLEISADQDTLVENVYENLSELEEDDFNKEYETVDEFYPCHVIDENWVITSNNLSRPFKTR
jgi:hypothetical protein